MYIPIIKLSHCTNNILPYGALLIGTALKKAGHEVEIIHLNKDEWIYCDRVIKNIMSKKPGFIAFSVISVETFEAAVFSKKCKNLNPEIPILWGGIHPSMMPEQTLKEDYVDYIIYGEGEKAIIEFTEYMEGHRTPTTILGLGYKREKQIFLNPERCLMTEDEMNKYEMDFSLVDVKKYIYSHLKYKSHTGFITSRGCSEHCTFCYNSKFNKSRFRAYSVDYILKHINYLKNNYNIDSLTYYDDHFFDDETRAIEVLRKVNIPFRAEIVINKINNNLLDELVKLQCREVMFGWESGNDRLLKLVGKRFKVKDIVRAQELLAKYNQIEVSGSGIIFLPTEKYEETYKTISLALEMSKINKNFVPAIGTYLPYPGAPLTKIAIKEGFKLYEKTEQWGIYDRYNLTQLNCEWIPWLTLEHKKKFEILFKYIRWCSSFYSNTKYFGIFKSIVGFLMYKISYIRVKYMFFYFPIEVNLFDIWSKYKYQIINKLKK